MVYHTISESKNYVCKEILIVWGNIPVIMLSEKNCIFTVHSIMEKKWVGKAEVKVNRGCF